MSFQKEPAVFSKKKYNLAEYEKQFTHYSGEKAIGEGTPYLFSWKAAERIYECVPNAKLIFCFRNPLERALSHYQYMVSRGEEKRHFNELLKNPTKEAVIQTSLYTEMLFDYLRLFKKEQCHFVVTERLWRDPVSVFKRLYSFLEVDPHFKLVYEGHKNVTLPHQPKRDDFSYYWNRGSQKGSFNRPTFWNAKQEFLERKKKSILHFYLSKKTSFKRFLIKQFLSKSEKAMLKRLFEPQKNRIEEVLSSKIPEWKIF